MHKGLIITPIPEGVQNFDLILKANNSLKPIQRFYNTGKILDQKSSSMCVGFSAEALLQAEPISQSFGAEKIYKRAKELDGLPNISGTSVYAGVKALESFGLIDKYYFAYRPDQVYEYVLGISPVLVGCVWTEKLENPN